MKHLLTQSNQLPQRSFGKLFTKRRRKAGLPSDHLPRSEAAVSYGFFCS